MKTLAHPVFSLALALAACNGTNTHAAKPQSIEILPGGNRGYLDDAQLPDSNVLVPPPPAAGSAAFANDQAISTAAYALRGTPRWNLASSDADLSFPHAAGTFACAVGARIDAAATPATYRLLQRSRADAGRAVHAAKDRYHRPRPFMLDGQPTCAPGDEPGLRKSGSYPSGHTSIGWAWALILAEAAPEHADAILARGRSFGESRLVCHVHWQSDVLEGRFMASSVVAKLHDDPTFRADLAAAKQELASDKLPPPQPDCAAEAAALSQPVPGAL